MILVVSLIFLMSCGKVEPVPGSGNGVGETKKTEALLIDDSSKATIIQICDALKQKAFILSQLVGIPYVFNYSEKKCDEESLSIPLNANVKITSSAAGYKFIQDDGTYFQFSDVETDELGVMTKICAEARSETSLSSPVKASDGNYIFFQTSGISASDCTANSGEACIFLQIGSPVTSATATAAETTEASIHTKDWIKFNVTDPRIGFFTMRKVVTQADCADGKTIERKADFLK